MSLFGSTFEVTVDRTYNEVTLAESNAANTWRPPTEVFSEANVPIRIGWLDGLRAVAVMGVVAVHSGQFIHGFTGVPFELSQLGQYGVQLFFVISAITICLTLRSHLLKKRETIISWYIRRLFRIMPLYYAAILVYAIDHILQRQFLKIDDGGLAPLAILANVGFVHAWLPGGNNNVVPGGWSIGVEMSFYIIAPALFLIVARKTWWPWAVGAFLVVLEVVSKSFASRYLGLDQIPNNTFAYYSPLTQFPVFLVGVSLFGATSSWLFSNVATPRKWVFFSTIGGVIAFGFAAYCGTWGGESHQFAPLLFGITFSCLILLSRGTLKSLIDSRPLRYIGKISYSIYIVHFALLDGCHLALRRLAVDKSLGPTWQFVAIYLAAFLLSVGAASVTHRLIESPGIRLGSRLASSM
jgi:peptidoglycan/LPS O-acetylase OafA/YrhL